MLNGSITSLKKIGCTPPYWNNNQEYNNEHDKICNSTKEMRLLQLYHWPLHVKSLLPENDVFNDYTQPCNKMMTFQTLFKYGGEPSGLLTIKMSLQDEFYQEILNTKAFGMADLWAGIGGYVGIFCGSSLLQATTYLNYNLKKCTVSTSQHCDTRI